MSKIAEVRQNEIAGQLLDAWQALNYVATLIEDDPQAAQFYRDQRNTLLACARMTFDAAESMGIELH